MSDLLVTETNAETGETVERAMTDAEAAQHLAEQSEWVTRQAAIDKAEAQRSSALAKIAASSGLTADELAALGL